MPQQSQIALINDLLAAAGVNQDVLEHLIHVLRFAGKVLVVPLYFSSVRIERQGRVGIERVAVGTADRSGPRFGLRRAPIDEVRFRIVAARDPRVAACAESQRQVAPCVAAGLTRTSNGGRSPQLLSAGRIMPADEADVLFVAAAPRHTRDHLAANDDWAGSVSVSQF